MRRTFERIGSFEVQERISLTVSGRDCKKVIECVISLGSVSRGGQSGKGSRLRTSAFACAASSCTPIAPMPIARCGLRPG